MRNMKTENEKRNGGMKAADGATGLRRVSANLDQKTIEVLKILGNGNLSAGVRAAARMAKTA